MPKCPRLRTPRTSSTAVVIDVRRSIQRIAYGGVARLARIARHTHRIRIVSVHVDVCPRTAAVSGTAPLLTRETPRCVLACTRVKTSSSAGADRKVVRPGHTDARETGDQPDQLVCPNDSPRPCSAAAEQRAGRSLDRLYVQPLPRVPWIEASKQGQGRTRRWRK